MALLALSLALWIVHARAASPGPAVLNLQIQLDSGVITVADLWANAGSKAQTVVGPAPPPGKSFAIEAAQLAYIARLYDVDWRPISGAERTSVERNGRPLTRDEISSAVRRSLVEAGASPSASIEFANFAPIMVPPMGFPLLSVESIAYDAAAERFSANMAAAAEGMPTQRMQVSGRVVQTATVVVATRRLQVGEVIGPADVRATTMPERRLASPAATEIAQVIGQSPKRIIVAGQPLSVADIGPPIMIVKGATVVMVLETQGMSLAAQGVALGSGGRDDIIQVMNPLSRSVMAARITGPGRTTIAPGSSPLVAPGLAGQRSMEVAN